MKITFHSFTLGDVEDVEIYAAQPIWEWQQTEKGKWIMENAYNLVYYTTADPMNYGYRVSVRGEINEKKATEYFLRWN
jgi:hypothetical protein